MQQPTTISRRANSHFNATASAERGHSTATTNSTFQCNSQRPFRPGPTVISPQQPVLREAISPQEPIQHFNATANDHFGQQPTVISPQQPVLREAISLQQPFQHFNATTISKLQCNSRFAQ
eukprot:1161827-Pelagomonas_calceolata.AAC.11